MENESIVVTCHGCAAKVTAVKKKQCYYARCGGCRSVSFIHRDGPAAGEIVEAPRGASVSAVEALAARAAKLAEKRSSAR